MKRYIKDCKAALCTALAVMLVLSMMSGVFTLSASADTVLNPVVVNYPTLAYSDFTKYYGEFDYQNNSFYDQPCSDDVWRNTLSTICVNLDDSNSERKTNEISRITYTYKDKNVEFTDEAFFKTVDSFGLLLVDTPLNYHASHILEGKWSNKVTSYYYPINYRTTRDGYLQFLYALSQARMSLNIYYDDETFFSVDVGFFEKEISSFCRVNSDNGSYHTVSAFVVGINLSDSNKSANEAFSELENAIKEVKTVKDDTVSRMYVDVDSEAPIVLPMDDISPSVELVQTRIGDNVVYNSYGSVNYGNESVNALQADDPEYNGNIYMLPNGSYSSDADISELIKYMWQNNYPYRLYGLNNEIYTVYPSKDTSVSNFKDGYFLDFDNYYKSFTGESNSNLDSRNANVFKSRSGISNSFSSDINRIQLYLNSYDNDKSHLFIEKLEELSRTLSDDDKNYLNGFYFCIDYSYKYKYNNNSYEYNSSSSYNGFRWNANYSNSDIKRRDYYFKPGVANDYMVNNPDYNYQYYEITNCYIRYMYYELGSDIIPSSAFINGFLNIINEVGFNIDNNNSYYPDVNLLYNPSESNKIYVSDILEELNITPENGRNQSWLGNFNYFGSYNGNTNVTVQRNQKLHETYEIGDSGKYLFDTDESIAAINTETYNDNREITFAYNTIKGFVEKGTVYNVINQIILPCIEVKGTLYVDSGSGDLNHSYVGYFENPQIWYNNDMNAVYEKTLGSTTVDSSSGEKYVKDKGSIYYLGGENIVSSNTAHVSDGSTDYGILRNTEYKWGEIVFVSKPDSVQNLTYDSDTQTLTWTKPVDEGYGTTDGQTNTDDYIKVNEYVVRIKDSGGNTVAEKKITRTDSNEVSFALNNLHLKNDNYTAEVTAKNVIGESTPVVTSLDLRMPEIEITMTPDQPTYEIDDTVTFAECVANTGRVPLTNVVVTQSVDGEYTAKNGVKINGRTATIDTLDIGQRVHLEYKTPAAVEVMNIIKNTAEVTANENVSDSFTSTVTVIKPGLSMTTTADKDTYKDGDTVVLTTVVTNTGNDTLKNIEVKHDIESGKFTELDSNKITTTENGTVAVIGTLNPGESTTLKYEIPAKDIETGKNAAAEVISTAKTEDEKLTAASVVDFTITRPALTVNANADEELVVYGDDVVYTVIVTNNGNCTLNNITVSGDLKGTFAENEAGSINKNGDFVITELAEGKSVTLVYTVPAKNTSVGDFTANFTAKDNKNNSASDKAPAEVLNYKVNILKLTDDEDHYLGEDILFRGIVTNRGNYELKNITVIEDIEGKFDLSDGAKAVGNNAIVIDSLMPGESYTYDYYVTATEDIIKNGQITGTAYADAGDNVKSSDTKSVTVYSPAVNVEKTVDSETIYNVGDTVEWTDVITNTGDCDLNNVLVSENFDGQFDTNDYKTNGNTLTIPKLAVGESVTLKYSTVIRQGDLNNSTYTSKVYVSSDEHISETASASVKVTGPAFKVTKYSDKETYYPDDQIVFTDAIINVGDKKLTNVTVTEDLEGEFIGIGEGFKAKGNVIVIPEIDVGDSAVVYYSPNRDVLTEKSVTSTITVTCDQNITDTAEVTITLADDTDTTNTDSAQGGSDTTNTDSAQGGSDTTNTDSAQGGSDTTNTDSAQGGSDTTNTDSANTDSSKGSTDSTNTDSSKDNTDSNNTDSTNGNTDSNNTDSTNGNTDSNSTDSSNGNTDSNNTDSSNGNTDSNSTDSAKTDTDSNNTDSSKPNTDSNSTDSSSGNTDSANTDSADKESQDQPGKESEDQPGKETDDTPIKMLMGDVNLDNKITARDSLLIQRYAIGLTTFNDLQLMLADVSENNKVSTGDALIILRYTVKLAAKSNTGTLIDVPTELKVYIKN